LIVVAGRRGFGVSPAADLALTTPTTAAGHGITGARAAGDDTIGPAHLVPGLLTEPEALATRAIVARDVTLDAVRAAATAALPPAVGQVPDLVPFDPEAKTAF
jgi:hypothetical protein